MAKTIANQVIDTLISAGIDQLYCLPGVQNDAFFNQLFDAQESLKPIQTRHEQGAAYMALGAALATGKPQACCVVPGPGFLNATAAISTAYATNAPVFNLVGQIPLGVIGKGFGLLHEIPDQLGVMKGLTKYAGRIDSTENANEVLSRAIGALTSGRPQPVGVEVPVNVWDMPASGPVSRSDQIAQRPELDTDKLDQVASLIAKAKRPLIVMGGGAQSFSEAVQQLANICSAPVMAFRNGHGVMPSDNPLHVSLPVGHELWRTCDLAIGLGSRLQTQQMQWGVDKDLDIVHIDIDATELGRVREPTIGIHADLADALPALINACEGKEVKRQDWINTIALEKVRFAKLYKEKLSPQLEWLNAIRDVLPHEGIFVDELTQVGYVSRFAFPSYAPRTFLSTGYQGTLGWGLASALGAAHARRDVPVVSISGDGGALYTITELATAVRHQIPLTTIVFNDNAFGNVRRGQIETYGNRPIASDLTSPDFAKLAESFGAQGLRAESPKELRLSLATAIAHSGPSVIEVPVGDFPSPWDFVLMPKVR